MKKINTFYRVAMTLLILLTMTLTASATTFITDVMLIGHDDEDEFNSLVSNYEAQGWIDIDYDLNRGAGGDYIHLLYKTQDSPGSSLVPITDFYFTVVLGLPNKTYGGRDGWNFDDVPYIGSEGFVNSQGDLNHGAGGDYIYLRYTKDAFDDFHAVTSITFNSDPSGAVSSNWSSACDLNGDCGSGVPSIYMHVGTSPNVVELTPTTENVLLLGQVKLFGTGGANTHVRVFNDATVTLDGVDITTIPDDVSHDWPALNCLGDAVIILKEGTTNNLKGGYVRSGISFPAGKTLTIKGNGTLNATGEVGSSGIGAGWTASCGNIVIEGGVINAYGGLDAPGIGGGSSNSSCGSITISGGTVTATGGEKAPGIGAGHYNSTCGDITITRDVTRVTATKGNYCDYAIGAGNNSRNCGTITIGGTVTGPIAESPFVTYPYTVSFNANGGTGTMDNMDFMGGLAQNLTANSFINANYEFLGWATSSDGPKVYDNGQSVRDLTEISGGTATLFAKWGLTFPIDGYNGGSGKWYLIASPFIEPVAPSAENGFITNAYDLFYFDQSFDLEWRNYKNENFLLSNGTGYLYASNENTTLVFTGTPYTGNGEIALAYVSSADLPGGNLIGNPFMVTAYVNRSFYVMNGDGTEIIAAATNSVAPMEGIFAVATYDGDVLTFSTTNSGAKDASLALNLSQNSSTVDRAVIRFDEENTLPKFQINPSNSKVCISQDGKDYAVVNAAGIGEKSVNFKASVNGTYTIGVSSENVEFSYLHLFDNLTGADIDLLATPSYTFSARTTDYSSRFKLMYATGNNDSESNFGFVSNGNLVIFGIEGEAILQMMDITGRICSSETFSGSYCKAIDAAQGVYVIRLIQGEKVRTQKIVVE